MISCEKGKFPYSFFILLTQWHKFSTPKLTNFFYFYYPSPFEASLFSKSPYLTAHIRINYEFIALEGFLKNHRDMSRIIATAKIELFVALVSSFSR